MIKSARQKSYYDEKRQFIRMLIETAIDITPARGQSTRTCLTKNISANGIQFIDSHKHAVGDKIKISVKPGNNSSMPLETTMEVVRIDANSEDRSFLIAGKFELVQ